MEWTAVKRFNIIEGTVPDGSMDYCIQVIDESDGKVIEEIRRKTMQEAQLALSLLGYRAIISQLRDAQMQQLHIMP